MTVEIATNRSKHFLDGGNSYASYRPTYPVELADTLTALAPDNQFAIDVGCGTGQISRLLAERFNQVLAFDISPDQILNATKHRNIKYAVAPAEQLPVGGNVADLVTVAQAAHWLYLEKFYQEFRRVGRKDAVLALISYGVMRLEETMQQRFEDFYWIELKPFWPDERRHVENGYAELSFPFEEIEGPEIEMKCIWPLDALLGYIETWSAVKAARRAGTGKIIECFATDIRHLWGNDENTKKIVWPINMRLGRI